MVFENDTNYVYFSSLLTTQDKYSGFWRKLEGILKKEKILFGFIEGTRDIWCRDYMPIQISENDFVQFKFFPDYYLEPDEIHKLTIPGEIKIDYRIDCRYSELIVDGGNIVKSGNTAILTEKIFTENGKCSPEKVLKTLKHDLEVDKVVILPIQPLDYTGHSDGMVKFLNENCLLVSDYSGESKSWKIKMDKALEKSGLEIRIYPSVMCDEKNEKGDYTAKGCYINFAQIGNKILLPQFDFPKDDVVLKETKTLFPDCEIIPINSNEIAIDGGVLNCITWNIKK